MPDAPDRAVRRGAASVAIAAILIVIVTIVSAANPGARDWIRVKMRWAPPTFAVGTSAHLPSALTSSHHATALIFAAANCAACERAQPAFRALAAAGAAANDANVRVLLTTPSDDAAQYAAMLGISPDAVSHFDARGSLVRRVPTIVIVDAAGIVRATKEGVPSQEEQHALVSPLTAR